MLLKSQETENPLKAPQKDKLGQGWQVTASVVRCDVIEVAWRCYGCVGNWSLRWAHANEAIIAFRVLVVVLCRLHRRDTVSYSKCLCKFFHPFFFSIASVFSHFYSSIQGSDCSTLYPVPGFPFVIFHVWGVDLHFSHAESWWESSLFFLDTSLCLANWSFCPVLNWISWTFYYQVPYIFFIIITFVRVGLRNFLQPAGNLSMLGVPFITSAEALLSNYAFLSSDFVVVAIIKKNSQQP